ncbi:MAG: hypothetical protein DBY32_11200 [Phascolarctobacterium sp.]|nr:MAG: hypothetical protein DBY32_11200 [Phascolarctobacterium sp.]
MIKVLDKIKLIYLTNRTYIRLTFFLIVIAFTYILKQGDIKFLVEVLKVALQFLNLLMGVQ